MLSFSHILLLKFKCIYLKDPKVNYVDIGGSYVGPTQDRLLRMAKEFKIENYKINEVEHLLHYKNVRIFDLIIFNNSIHS